MTRVTLEPMEQGDSTLLGVTGEQLRRMRGQAGISLKAMAEQIGCSPDDLARVELGEDPVTWLIASTVVKVIVGIQAPITTGA